MRSLPTFVLGLWLGSAAQVFAADVEFLNGSGSLDKGLPFSEAVRVGDLLFLSGQLGVKGGGMDGGRGHHHGLHRRLCG